MLGRFTVGERIGSGGYGTVHRAWDERLCRDVAVKAVEGSSAGRVLREAHAAARLNHPSIVTLYELGEENGCTYLVSELVKGPNLRELAAAAGLSDRELAEIGVELCAALSHAHAQGVVHRDIKPDNVLVRRSAGRRVRSAGERALLADFGIASIADEPSLTATGQVVGTLAYMSPEQAAGEQATTASDVYALGLTLFELWAGENPVAAATTAATARRIGSELPPLEQFRPELPPALCAAIDACLRADAGERPELAELAGALRSTEGALHPDRALPEPEQPVALSSLSEELPARPFAVLLACGAIAALGLLTGLAGLAVVAVALFAPAALLLSRPREWALPIAAPVLGLAGVAPALLVVAAAHARPAARPALAVLAWAWTGLAGVALGQGLGVLDTGAAAGWAGSGPLAFDELLAPLLGADALATALIWAGSVVLLGAMLEFAGPALLALLGLVWSAGLVAALGAVGGASAPELLLAPALIGSILWLSWDRAGRPLPAKPALAGESGFGPWLGALLAPAQTVAAPTAARPPRNPAEAPLADNRVRATRAASRHVSAALHGAGSRSRLP